MSPTPTMQKLMNLIHEFGGGDRGENEAKMASASTKTPTGADYLSSNHVSHAISNIVSNSAKKISNYPTSDAKKAFDQLRQSFTKALILQYFKLEQYIRVEIDASRHAIGEMLSQLTNNLGQLHPVAYFSRKMISAKT